MGDQVIRMVIVIGGLAIVFLILVVMLHEYDKLTGENPPKEHKNLLEASEKRETSTAPKPLSIPRIAFAVCLGLWLFFISTYLVSAALSILGVTLGTLLAPFL